MTVPERLTLDRPPSIPPDIVRQHATPKCTRTPITTATTTVGKHKTSLHFALEPRSALSKPSFPISQQAAGPLPIIEIP
jgi:hypothetical protein